MKPLNLGGTKMGTVATVNADHKSGNERGAESTRRALSHIGHPRWHTWRIWGNDSVWLHQNDSAVFLLNLVIGTHLIFGASIIARWARSFSLIVNLNVIELCIWLGMEAFALLLICGIYRNYRKYKEEELTSFESQETSQGEDMETEHMVMGAEGMTELPDDLAEQYKQCCYPGPELFKEDHPCARLSGRLVRWCWDNGYPKAKAVLFEKLGAADHALAVVEVDGQELFFDLTANTVKPQGPDGWTFRRKVFKDELLNVPEWQ